VKFREKVTRRTMPKLLQPPGRPGPAV